MQSIARAQKPVRGRPGCFSAPFPTAMSTHARPAPLLIRRNSAPHYRTWQSPDSAITQAWRDHSPAGGGCGGPCPAPDSDSDIETQQQQHGTRVASNVGPAYNNITAYTGPSASAARKAFPTILEELDQINSDMSRLTARQRQLLHQLQAEQHQHQQQQHQSHRDAVMTRVGYSGSGTGAGAAAVAPGAAAPTGATGWARSSLGGSLSSSDLLSMEALGLREGAVGNALASVDHPQPLLGPSTFTNAIKPRMVRRAATPEEVELVLLCDAPDRDAFLVERVSVLLGLGTHVNVTDENGWTALANAAFRGHLQVARLLLAAGADIDARNHNDQAYTPLICAAEERHRKMCILLLLHGADVRAQDAQGRGPLDHFPELINDLADAADLRAAWLNSSGN